MPADVKTDAQGGGSAPSLDDVMIAMDVVDTIRHDHLIVERELNDDVRRRDLIDRLREIYKAQGMDVPDHVLEEGVRALEDDRFSYTPPKDSLSARLARFYVTRSDWGRYVLGGLAAIALIFLGNYLFIERPREIARLEQARTLAALPARLDKAASDIASEAAVPGVGDRARAIAQSGSNAARSGDLKGARTAEQELTAMLAQLRQEFEVRVVNEEGELSGLWRIPPNNPNAYNFYLVVEAVDASGRRLEQAIMNEETGRTDRVSRWAVRVDRDVLEAVKADKEDDGIIQKAIVGRKVRGKLEPDWTIPVQGGAITRWE